MTSLKWLALGATATLALATGAQAESTAMRMGGTVYPVPQPVAAAQVAPPPATTVAPVTRGRHRWAGRRDTARPKVEASAVETGPAPTPDAASKSAAAAAPSQAHEEGAPTIRDLVSKHAKENGVPEDLAAAVVRIESRFNPSARGGSALGLMQIKYQTARSVGFSGSAAGLMQAETNLHFGMKVLADAYRASHGNVCMTLARYQSGGRITHMSAANRSYCSRARAFMAKL